MRRNLLLLLLWLAGLLAVDAQTLSRKEVETYVINQYGKRWKEKSLSSGVERNVGIRVWLSRSRAGSARCCARPAMCNFIQAAYAFHRSQITDLLLFHHRHPF